jgi:hypothetical protein
MTLSTINIIRSIALFSFIISFSGCDTDDPEKEDTPELITKVTMTFTPDGGGNTVTVSATDPDGDGVADVEADDPIDLSANTSYTLAIALVNSLAQPTDPGYDITVEVQEEADEHLFFFGWTGDVFSDPEGNGNIDNRDDAINYEDDDENGLPLGLSTFWTTGDASSGTFRVILKHQPELKSVTSDAETGETDLDVTFIINVE